MLKINNAKLSKMKHLESGISERIYRVLLKNREIGHLLSNEDYPSSFSNSLLNTSMVRWEENSQFLQFVHSSDDALLPRNSGNFAVCLITQ